MSYGMRAEKRSPFAARTIVASLAKACAIILMKVTCLSHRHCGIRPANPSLGMVTQSTLLLRKTGLQYLLRAFSVHTVCVPLPSSAV
ncbi:hypothetical protein [Burkholderia ubonensis]|uniref:hypothetical protein n=1 Tax=Burkholderia ubonensis TaxID=101571 RepID=UPI000F56F14D|nr:hypothetical protein [Burkholderia ubonensis]